MKTSQACPSCGCKGPHAVTHTRHHETHFRGKIMAFTRRRKVCRHCGLPYWTREVDEDVLDQILQDDPQPPELPEDLLG